MMTATQMTSTHADCQGSPFNRQGNPFKGTARKSGAVGASALLAAVALLVAGVAMVGCSAEGGNEPEVPVRPVFEVTGLSAGMETVAGQDVAYLDAAVRNVGAVDGRSFRLTVNLKRQGVIVDEASAAWGGLLRPGEETTLRLRFAKVTAHDAYDEVDYAFSGETP